MLKQMRTRLLRSWKLGVGISVLATLAAVACERLRWMVPLDNFAYDQSLRSFTPEPKRSRDITIIGIDDRTIQSIASNPDLQVYGSWPYSRRLWAQVLDYLQSRGARAVVFDMVMDERYSDLGEDAVMAKVLAGLRLPVFIGFSMSASSDYHALPRLEAAGRTDSTPAPAAPTPEEADPFSDDALDKELKPPTPEESARALAFPVLASGLTVPLLQEGEPPRVLHPVPPIAPLLRGAAGFGMVTPEQDGDGLLRRTRFAYADETHPYALLPVVVAAKLLGAERVELAPERLKLGSRELAINPDGSARLDYGGPLDKRYRTVSLINVLADIAGAGRGGLAEDELKGKVVVIAGFALGTSDLKPTPFESSAPGVAKQVATLDSLLFGRFITDSPPWLAPALAAAVALMSFVLVFGFGSRTLWVGVAWLVVAVPGLFCLGGLLVTRAHLYLPLSAPVLALGISSAGAFGLNLLFADRERERMRQMFSRYVSRDVVAQLLEQPDLPQLAGEDRCVTAFFSDIRGFSTFSEQYKDNPRALVKILNTYLTRLSTVLLENGACLDKYIGDAIVCLFGAPVSHPDHAVRACRAALAAQAEVARLREEFRREGLPDVYTRIGINTATMFVGNFGSEQLFNYTAMGDGMNLASRLEGANKSYGSSIMIGPQTREQAGEFIEVRELDRVRVAGKHEPVAVYELLGMKGELPEPKRRMVELYHRALGLYREARFEEARAALDRALELEPGDGPSQVLRARCEKLLLHPPPMPFEGVTNLEK